VENVNVLGVVDGGRGLLVGSQSSDAVPKGEAPPRPGYDLSVAQSGWMETIAPGSPAVYNRTTGWRGRYLHRTLTKRAKRRLQRQRRRQQGDDHARGG